MSEQEWKRLETAERQLLLVQSFFPRIDSKVSALFAISSAEVAVAAVNLSPDDITLWYIMIPAAIFLMLVIGTFWNLYRCAYPHLKGGSSSLVYFAEIAKRTEADYLKKYKETSIADLTDDVIGQIWRNSEIVAAKYRHLKNATISSMASIVPWSIFLIAVSLTHHRIPIIH